MKNYSRLRAPTVLTPWSPDCCGTALTNMSVTSLGSAVSAVYPTANTALFFPFELYRPALAQQVFVHNGAGVLGNWDIGVYTREATPVRIFSSGSIAESGVNTVQLSDITDITLPPGEYYLAFSANDAVTAAYFHGTVAAAINLAAAGIAEQASAFALPATATLATIATNYVPLFGITFVPLL